MQLIFIWFFFQLVINFWVTIVEGEAAGEGAGAVARAGTGAGEGGTVAGAVEGGAGAGADAGGARCHLAGDQGRRASLYEVVEVIIWGKF